MSLFIWHNETLNIYTHLLPGLYYLWKALTLVPSGGKGLQFLQVVSYLAAATMGITSGVYHLLWEEKGWLVISKKMDFLGIIAINYAHILLDTFLFSKGVWKSSDLCILGFFLETILTLICAARIVMSELDVGRVWAITYAALTIPFTCVIYVYSDVQGAQDSLNCSFFIVVAGSFFISGFPERYYNPGGVFNKFGSHTWHHIFIVCSIVAAFEALPKLSLID